MNTLYTMGYTGRKIAEIASTAKAARAMIVDIRYSAQSRVHIWNGPALRSALALAGIDYAHIPDLGNLNYKTSGPVVLKNADAGIHALLGLLEKQNCIILCACQWLEDCHRKPVSEIIQARGVLVNHIGRQRKDEVSKEQFDLF